MRDRIPVSFYSPTNIPDGYGGTISGNQLVLSTRGSVKPLKSSRELYANQTTLNGGFEITIRYRKDFTPTKSMTIRYDNMDLTIQQIENVGEENRFWKIVAMGERKAKNPNIDPAVDLTGCLVYDFTTVDNGQKIDL